MLVAVADLSAGLGRTLTGRFWAAPTANRLLTPPSSHKLNSAPQCQSELIESFIAFDNWGDQTYRTLLLFASNGANSRG
jgi:hypothetical protein